MRTAAVYADGELLGHITLNDGNLTATTPALQEICDTEAQAWESADTAYRWLLHNGNGYLVVTEE